MIPLMVETNEELLEKGLITVFPPDFTIKQSATLSERVCFFISE
jgi:hypothetical protein